MSTADRLVQDAEKFLLWVSDDRPGKRKALTYPYYRGKHIDVAIAQVLRALLSRLSTYAVQCLPDTLEREMRQQHLIAAELLRLTRRRRVVTAAHQ